MMSTITGLFESHEAADAAIRALAGLGLGEDEISVALRAAADDDGPVDEPVGTTEGALGGGAVGGLTGLLLGLGAIAIPGIGPLFAAGPIAGLIAGALTGAATGGLLGTLVEAGIDEAEAHHFLRALERGGVLVAVNVDDDNADAVRRIMARYSAPEGNTITAPDEEDEMSDERNEISRPEAEDIYDEAHHADPAEAVGGAATGTADAFHGGLTQGPPGTITGGNIAGPAGSQGEVPPIEE